MDGRKGNQRPERRMTRFVNELMSRNARRSDEPDAKNRAIALRELALADGRAWVMAWMMGRAAH